MTLLLLAADSVFSLTAPSLGSEALESTTAAGVFEVSLVSVTTSYQYFDLPAGSASVASTVGFAGGSSVRRHVKSTRILLAPPSTKLGRLAFSCVVRYSFSGFTWLMSPCLSMKSPIFSRVSPRKSAPAWRSLPTTGISPSSEAVRSATSV